MGIIAAGFDKDSIIVCVNKESMVVEKYNGYETIDRVDHLIVGKQYKVVNDRIEHSAQGVKVCNEEGNYIRYHYRRFVTLQCYRQMKIDNVINES